MRTLTAGVALAMALLVASPVAAQSMRNVALEDAADVLNPQQYVWRDTDPAIGDVAIVISRGAQVAYVYRGETLIGVASVSTGKPGKRTPIGDFTILQKRVFHRSNIYSNAPMPYMQRLTWDGIAIHAGHNPGYPASHGCIRLPREFAMLLFGVTRMGASVAVIDGEGGVAPLPTQRFPVIIADAGGFDGDGFAEVTWRPAMLPWTWGLRPSANLRVTGDEWLVPDAPLYIPMRGF